ncbi:MAG TPA: phosphoenolpyruvate--protein phosphotransferase [Pyrinomonadaceae bacterium]|nr:phosphoenolpyruvate--protein phosphotransferase [Pyrinomonadaceae bacterium]
MAERRLQVTGRLGLHARAAANLVRVAGRFQSSLTLHRLDSDVEADAKSILSILTLAASRGTELRVVANGVDEQEALDAVVGLFSRDFDETERQDIERSSSATQELRCKGLGVSDGLVIGRVLRLQDGTREVYRAQIAEADIERERRRFRAAVRLSRRQLEAIKDRAEKELGRGHAYIFDAHLLFLEDAKLTRDVEDYIVKQRSNAEWAAKVVGDRLLSIYTQINDEYLRERGSDIEDVIQRLLANLTGEGPKYPNLSGDAVIVARDLLPSTIAELDLNHVKAIATDTGGWTSHMAIIARGLGLTAVVGLNEFYGRTRTGDQIIVDARRGEVILHPDPATVEEYKFTSGEHRDIAATVAGAVESGPVTTRDGVSIALRANVELPHEFQAVRNFGACGVGLFRSEFLLSRPGLMHSEEDQYQAYRALAEAAGADGAVVRLFDVGGEVGSEVKERERNPALGLRAVRFNLRNKEVMRTQVRAILRAAVGGRLSLVIPMIADVADVRLAQKVIAEELESLGSAKIPSAKVPIGAMIEVPSAVLTAEKIASEVDFFELGTNDLVQYTLAVDRGNDKVSDWFRTLHPAVLYGIQRTLEAAGAAAIPVIVCGEMASTPAYAVLLVGMGAIDLSMTPAMIPRVRAALAQIDTGEAREVAARCLGSATADEVEEIVRHEFRMRWPDLFPPRTLPKEPEPSA